MPLLVLLSVLQRDRTHQLDRAIALATHDPLTGLPNRTLFHERLDEQLADRRTDRGAARSTSTGSRK